MALSKKQEYELVKRYLGNPNALKVFLKGQDLDWVNSVYKRIGELIIELTQEAELERAEAQERENKRLELIAMIEAEGWKVEDLIKEKSTKAKTSKKADKYRFPDENGKERTWSGFGAKPKALQALLDAGHSLDKFLIEKKESDSELSA